LGFVALAANPGMGKTTLLFETLRRLGESTRTVFLFQTISSPEELFRALLIDLGETDTHGDLVELQTRLNQLLVSQNEAGRRLVVAIDEAQNLNDSVLEAVRMLSNFETSSQKLMQIILCGQLQLAEKLAQPHLLQLRQRISIFAHLKQLSPTETAAYIQHRLRVAGYDSDKPLFTSAATAMIAKHSDGIPRNINNLCFNALSLGCALQHTAIDTDVICEVLADLDIEAIQATAKPAEAVAKRPVEEAKTETTLRTAKMPQIRLAVGLAAVCAIVAIFGKLIVLDYKAFYGDTAVQASMEPARQNLQASEATALTPVSSQGVGSAVAADQIGNANTRQITVREGQSLYAICAENFGDCQPNLLRQILKMNPRIAHPDHIESGQKVVLPVFANSPANRN
jgi:type II secretory pathway predicted ATPase ExeA